MAVRAATGAGFGREFAWRSRSCARRAGSGGGRRSGFRGIGAGDVVALDPAGVIAGEQISWEREQATDDGSGRANPWIDKYTGCDLGQTTAGSRPAITAVDAAFNNFLTINPDGVDDVLIATTGTESVFKPLHDYTGFLAAFAFSSAGTSAEEFLWATCSSSVQIGIRVRWDSVAEALMVAVANGVTDIHSVKTANGTVPKNQKNRIVLWIKDGLAGNEWEIWNNDVLIMAGTLTGSPSAANPTIRLVTFRLPSGSSNFHAGKWAELLLITNVALVAQARKYLRQRYP